MSNRNCPHQKSPDPPSAPIDVPVPPETEMRRWRHPVESNTPSADVHTHYLRCSLAYQNQLLAEIKTLLEKIVLQVVPEEGEK